MVATTTGAPPTPGRRRVHGPRRSSRLAGGDRGRRPPGALPRRGQRREPGPV